MLLGELSINVAASVKSIIDKGYIWNPATCNCKNGKYLASIIDNSVITCEEVRDAEAKPYGEETKATAANFNEKNAICKTKKLHILLASLLITIALLLAVISYCYLIKYKSKKNIYYHIMSQTTNLKKFFINNIL